MGNAGAAQSFTTEFGNTIPFLPNYFERNKDYAYYVRDIAFCDTKTRELGAGDAVGTLKDYIAFSATVEFLSTHSLIQNWGRGIDLGGAEGLTIRLFKAAGLIENATNLDLAISPNVTDDYCRKFLRRVVFSADPMHPMLSEIGARARNAQQHAVGQTGVDGLHKAFPNDPTLDVAAHESVFDHQGKYDFVNSNQFLQYFDPHQILPKVRDLMNTGGLMVGFVDCWWFPITSVGLVGHFPYSAQRLSPNDLKRYWSEHHPDLLESYSQKYASYLHPGRVKPTAADWRNLALEYGFEPVAIGRVVPGLHSHVRDMPADIFANPLFSEREALRDMHHINPAVRRDDLFTAYFRLAFHAV